MKQDICSVSGWKSFSPKNNGVDKNLFSSVFEQDKHRNEGLVLVTQTL